MIHMARSFPLSNRILTACMLLCSLALTADILQFRYERGSGVVWDSAQWDSRSERFEIEPEVEIKVTYCFTRYWSSPS